MIRRRWRAAALGLLAAGGALSAADRAADTDWPSWGRTSAEMHYTPLAMLNVANVGKLALAWHFDLEPGYSASLPLQAEGKLFFTTGHSHIRALDAASGKLLWEYDGGTRARAPNGLYLAWGNKGIAYDAGRVFLVTTDGWVIALDAASGRELWKTYDYPDAAPRNSNGAPRVFGGRVIVGFGGADISPVRGYVSAYDARTGKLDWRFYTTPGGDPAAPPDSRAEALMRSTWPSGWTNPDGSRRGGGGTAWNAFSYDAELGLIYIGVGNGYPYNRDKRSPGGGDNLFLASVVAVDAATGAYRWHYQVCPGEQWDCTATADMTLATLTIDGRPRKVLMQAPKNGFFYVLDRATGAFISAEKIARVTWAERIDPATGRPVENPGIRYNGKPGMFELWPATQGAHSWVPMAFSPRTALTYVPVMENGALIGDLPAGDAGLGSGMGVAFVPEVDLPGGHRAMLKAWDPVRQREAWRVALPGNWPAGVLATGGDLVFQGRIDGRFVAYDARSGKALWSFTTESPILAAPISYSLGGRQYVTVITGNGGVGASILSPGNAAYRTDYALPRRVLTFAVGGKDRIAPFTPPRLVVPEDPGFVPDAATAQAGGQIFAACMSCHGWNAIGGGGAPDLRYSATIMDAQAFDAVVRKGALTANGMPVFDMLSPPQVEMVRHYLRLRAAETRRP